ncbi:MAG: SusE domain-containing protein [Tannerellaceae bacterium]|jgi:hypothetical protein|nr:SusE domain-containing protein [Tannerellaceae bacterium]
MNTKHDIFVPLLFVASLFAGCDKLEQVTAYGNDRIVGPQLQSTGPVIITEDNYATGTTTFSWKGADFGYPAQVSYAIYAGYGSVSDYCLFENINTTSYTVSNEALYTKLTGVSYLGLPTGTTDISMYVTATIGSRYEVIKSAPATLRFELAELSSVPTLLYLPGSYNGWDMYSHGIWGTKNVFKGYVDMNAADSPVEFKFLTSKGEWLGNTLDAIGEGGNLTTASGLYYVTADLNEYKATLIPFTIVGLTGINGTWATPAVALPYDAASKRYKATIDVTATGSFRVLCYSPEDAAGWFWSYTLGVASADDIDVSGGSAVRLLPPSESGVAGDGNMMMRETGTFEFAFYYNPADSYFYLSITKK